MTVCMILPGIVTTHIHKFTNGGKVKDDSGRADGAACPLVSAVNGLTEVVCFTPLQEKRVARIPWQWYLLERDRRVSGTGHYFNSK
ncbi:hypothetical protein GOODEAATRI_006861, partial [Goodea atripinnis]